MPPAAAADSSRPSDRARNGSTRSSTSTAAAKAWRPSPIVWRSVAAPRMATIVQARRTLGSNRVRTANHVTATAIPNSRWRGDRATNSRPIAATTRATFEPLTAVR